MSISFILPVYNEEANIERTLASIYRYQPEAEVIIVNNGSTDDTVEIINSVMTNNTKLHHLSIGNVAQVRNYGVSKSNGEILVFLDADVALTEQWNNEINNVITKLQLDPYIVTGYRCLVPIELSNRWLNKYWFNFLEDTNSEYINSGHMITSRILFDRINGFSESLDTAEDVDFSIKAKSVKAKIEPNMLLVTYHYGYPETLKDFIRREMWHGVGDLSSLKMFVRSRVAIISLFQVGFLMLVFFSIITIESVMLFIGSLLAIYFLNLVLTLVKFGNRGLKSLLITPIIFFIYFVSRFLSIGKIIFK